MANANQLAEWLREEKGRKDRICHEYLRSRKYSVKSALNKAGEPTRARAGQSAKSSERIRISNDEVVAFLEKARATSTQTQYRSVARGYSNFVATQDPSAAPFPIDAEMLIRYVAYLTKIGRASSTIFKYIRVLRVQDRACKGARPWSTSEEELMRLAREAVRRICGTSPPTQALTLTDGELRNAALVTPRSGRKEASTAVLLGVAACLRPGELHALNRKDIVYDAAERALWVTVREGKTDIERVGETVLVSCCCENSIEGPTYYCPVHRTLKLLEVSDVGHNESIFGCSRSQLDEDIKEILRVTTGRNERATSHALRRSAAHLMAARGVSPQQIADHGRWRSTTTVINTYLRQSSSYKEDAQEYSMMMFAPQRDQPRQPVGAASQRKMSLGETARAVESARPPDSAISSKAGVETMSRGWTNAWRCWARLQFQSKYLPWHPSRLDRLKYH
ncbi:hypothetical protein FOZ63_030117 [Perkinsus olseni]|uniref:Tyr recombinase domain-containing protein n=1 Tax=Perkinsus olseni TaxID=32597 RepID=A0A7J6TAN3_PEROL|nr:hypothetical protein FOZ63_030117 [Perkinsus olseni]